MSPDERFEWAATALDLAGRFASIDPDSVSNGVAAAGAVNVHGIVARLDLETGPWADALTERDLLPSVRRTFVALGNVPGGAWLDRQHAFDLIDLGRHVDAEGLLNDALDVYTEEGLSRADLLLIRGDLRRLDGDWIAAAEAFEAADELLDHHEDFERNPYSFDVRIRYHAKSAALELDLGRMDRAWDHLSAQDELIAEYLRAAPQEPWLTLARSAELQARAPWGDYFLLSHRVEELIAEIEATGSTYPAANTHLGMALAQVEVDDPTRPPRARDILVAEANNEALPSHVVRSALLSIAHLDLAQNDLDGAAATLAQLEAALASGGDAAASPSTKERAYHAALALRLARLQGRDEEALEKPLARLERELDALLDSWAKAPISTGGIGFLQLGRRADIFGELLAGCHARGQLDRALPRLFAAQAMGTLSRGLGVVIPTLDQVRASLIGAGGALIYLSTRSRTHIVALGGDDSAYAHTTGNRPLENAVVELVFHLEMASANPEDARLGRAVDALAQMLLPPAVRERVAGWEHVYIVGSDFLHDPPFELLPFGEGRLGTEKAVAYLPSIPLAFHLWGRLGEPEALEAGDAVVLASPPPGTEARRRWAELGPLPRELQAGERLTAAFPGSRPIEGPDATRRALAFAGLEEARLLHLFAHGAHDEERPLPQCLVLAEDGADNGLVYAEDIRSLHAPELVVLSACEAVWGKRRTGEDGANNLGGAFFEAGASTVVASRVPMEANATLRTMEVFHRELAAGQPVGEALRRARVSVDPADAVGAAHIVALGPAHHRLFLPPPRWRLPRLALIAGGALLLAAAAYALTRRAGA